MQINRFFKRRFCPILGFGSVRLFWFSRFSFGRFWIGNGLAVSRQDLVKIEARLVARLRDWIAGLARQWAGVAPDADGVLLAEVLGARVEALDLFDRAQLAAALVRDIETDSYISDLGRRAGVYGLEAA